MPQVQPVSPAGFVSQVPIYHSSCSDHNNLTQSIFSLQVTSPKPGSITAGHVYDTDVVRPGVDCDPFLVLSIPALRQTRQTRCIRRTRNPEWNETLQFTGVTGRQEILNIRCFVRSHCHQSICFVCVVVLLRWLVAGQGCYDTK